MPEQEELEKSVTLQPVSRPTIASQLKEKATAPFKKTKPVTEPVRQLLHIAEQTKQTGKSSLSQKSMPRGIFHETHPDHEGALYTKIKDKLEEEQIEGLQIIKCNLVMMVVQDPQDDPKTIQEVKSRLDWLLWKAPMDKELATLEKAGTWDTVIHPEGKNIIGSKWVFHIKRKANGSIDKYKV